MGQRGVVGDEWPMVKCGDGLVPPGVVGGVRRRVVCKSVHCSRSCGAGHLPWLVPLLAVPLRFVSSNRRRWVGPLVGPHIPACSRLIMLCCVLPWSSHLRSSISLLYWFLSASTLGVTTLVSYSRARPPAGLCCQRHLARVPLDPPRRTRCMCRLHHWLVTLYH